VLAGGGVFRFQVDGRPRASNAGADTWLGVWYQPREIARELDRSSFEIVEMWGQHTHYLWVTARRRSRPGRPDTQRVRVRRRAWRREALEALLSRLGVEATREAEAVLAGERSLRQLAQPFLDEQQGAAPEEFVRRAYEVLLGREADAGGLAFYAGEIEGGIPPSNTVDCLISSSELEEQLRPEAEPVV
jgi:hypothetical protein